MPVVALFWNDSVSPSPFVAVLVDALRDKGWVAGRDFRIDDRISLEGYTGYVEAAAALVKARPDVIVAFGSTSVSVIAKATKEIPIVMNAGADPVASGLVASLARPGGNLTGVVNTSATLFSKRIELLKELIPGLSSFGVVLSPNVNSQIYVRESETAARRLNLQVHFGQVNNPEDLDSVVAELAKKRVGALYLAPSSMLQARSARVVEVVAKYRLPAVYTSDRYVDAGGLMVYGASAGKAFVRAAGYVDRILKGARPGELAIEQISEVELVMNLKTAKSLGIKVPAPLLVRADRVIE